jgi:hypothetical protein
MINLQIMTMEEYQPINGDVVAIYLLDRRWGLVTAGIDLKMATCNIHYQMFNAEDKSPCPTWTSNSTSEMARIPFNTPFDHIVGNDGTQIVGFRLLKPKELQARAKVAGLNQYYHHAFKGLSPDSKEYKEIEREQAQDMFDYNGVPGHYWEKRWFFDVMSKDDKQIHDTDQDNEVLGIMDKDTLGRELMEIYNANKS